MSLRAYLIVMSLATVLAVSTLALVVFRVDPETAGFFGHALLYIALFFSVVGLFSLFGLVIRIIFRRDEIVSRLAAASFRQAIIIGCLAVFSLFLYKKEMLVWWNGIMLAAAATLVEFFFISIKQKSEGGNLNSQPRTDN
jgi:hypothetical protein